MEGRVGSYPLRDRWRVEPQFIMSGLQAPASATGLRLRAASAAIKMDRVLAIVE